MPAIFNSDLLGGFLKSVFFWRFVCYSVFLSRDPQGELLKE